MKTQDLQTIQDIKLHDTCMQIMLGRLDHSNTPFMFFSALEPFRPFLCLRQIGYLACRSKTLATLAIIITLMSLTGCVATMKDQVLDSGSESQLAQRSYQTRAFDTTDKQVVMRGVISTLQDLGFVIDRADATLGSVSATKLNAYLLKITVSVRPRGTTQLLVRANAQYNVSPVEDPKPYQDFFNSLSKSLFLQAQNVE